MNPIIPIIIVLVLIVIGGIIAIIVITQKAKAPLLAPSVTPSGTPPPAPPPALTSTSIKPRPAKIIDCGYGDRPRAWYDIQGQGAQNDYCRYVGNHPGRFSCQLAGGTSPSTPPGLYDGKINDPHTLFEGGHGC